MVLFKSVARRGRENPVVELKMSAIARCPGKVREAGRIVNVASVHAVGVNSKV
jgi:hypothetical protein